jgi:5-oxoprolinase (ATP-hydrolysing)
MPPGSLSFRLGTTKGTNTLLENKGAPVALFLSEGFEDLLIIRDQKRPDLFAREIKRPAPIYQGVFSLRGRLDTHGEEREGLDEDHIREAAKRALDSGCTVAAVCLLNSWANPAHEQRVGEILGECGFETICLSSTIRPLIKYLDRADTTLVDATLSPVMDHYLDRVQAELGEDPLWVMSSAGGLVSRSRFHAVDSLVSGPAGGVLGAVAAGRQAGLSKIIALDMGGTSTDVSRWKDHMELRQQIQVGPARILTPAMPIETVAAGGGSICGFDGERLFVGPESAGADPGPAAYGSGGPLTLTDIHLLLGRIDPDGFSIPIQVEASRTALTTVAGASGETDWPSLAEGFLTIATERMAHAIRKVSLREGEDPSQYGLVAFGGAGGLHACRVAAELGMSEVVFPADAGILSARGDSHRAKGGGS